MILKNYLTKLAAFCEEKAESLEGTILKKIKTDFARSPKEDCFVNSLQDCAAQKNTKLIVRDESRFQNQGLILKLEYFLLDKQGKFGIPKNLKKYTAMLTKFRHSAYTKNRMELTNLLSPINKLSDKNKFEIAKSARKKDQIAIKATFAKKLAELEEFSGDDIQRIVCSANTKKLISIKTNQLEEFKKIKELSGENLSFILASTSTKEQAETKAKLLKELLTNKNIEKSLLGKILELASDEKKAEAILKRSKNEHFLQNIETLDSTLGNEICLNVIGKGLNPEKINYSRINSLYKFINENKIGLKQAKTTIKSEQVANLFDSNMMKTLELVDDGTIKYALKLKMKKFGEFIKDTSMLTENLGPEDTAILKQKLSQLTMPEQKLEKLQALNSLMYGDKKDAMKNILEGISLIHSPKTTPEQLKIAEEIFTSDNTFEEKITQFLNSFNVPENRRQKLTDFFIKNNFQEKVTVNNKTKEKVLNSKAKELLVPQIEAHINAINNNKKFSDFTHNKIYEKIKFNASADILETMKFEQQYLPNLFYAVTNKKDFAIEFKKLLELVKANPDKKFTELREAFEHNKKTKELFEKNGINYERWSCFDSDFTTRFTMKTNSQEATKVASEKIAGVLNSQELKALDNNETSKIIASLKEAGYIVKPDGIANENGPCDKNDLEKVVEILKSGITKNSDYWEKPLGDKQLEEMKQNLVVKLLKTCRKEVSELSNKNDEEVEMITRLSDNNDLSRNLFFGNHVGCCTAVEGEFGVAAVQNLKNSFLRGMEVVDKAGNAYGNSLCCFSKVDGRLAFIIDNFELRGKASGSPDVTDSIVKYALEITKAMGQPNIPIYFGPNNNLYEKLLKQPTIHSIEILGKSDSYAYLDAIGKRDINFIQPDCKLYEVR